MCQVCQVCQVYRTTYCLPVVRGGVRYTGKLFRAIGVGHTRQNRDLVWYEVYYSGLEISSTFRSVMRISISRKISATIEQAENVSDFDFGSRLRVRSKP